MLGAVCDHSHRGWAPFLFLHRVWDVCVARYTASSVHGATRLVTKQPELVNGVYSLNFGGRVRVASVKNFQLTRATDERKEVILQFGKIGDDRFVLDYKPPMSRLQAFAAALAHLNV